MSAGPVPIDSSRPIFIVGAPRSGTTVLRAMLNRHPRIGLCDETHFFYYVYSRRGAFGDLSVEENRRRLVDRYLEMVRIRRFELDLDRLRHVLMVEGLSYAAFFRCLQVEYARQNGKSRIGEKTPYHGLHAGTLCEWYPECRIVHLIRDPRDVVASLLRMPWGPKSVLANAKQWVRCTLGPQRVPGANYACVYYEDLVADPESELSRILELVGEGFRERMLVAGQGTDDRWWMERARQPLTRSRVGTWERQLTEIQVATIERVAGPLMCSLGYQLQGEDAPRWEGLQARAGELADAVRIRMTALPRMWYYWIQPTRLAREEAWNDRWTRTWSPTSSPTD